LSEMFVRVGIWLSLSIALAALCVSAVAEDDPGASASASVKEIWNRTYGGSGIEFAGDVQVTRDGGCAIIGTTDSFGSGGVDAWLIKTDPDGNEMWNRTFGGPKYDLGASILQTRDGGYIITGETESYGAGGSDVWLIKTDPDGMRQWDRTFGGPDFETGLTVMESEDGSYVIVGGTKSYGAGDLDVWMIRTDHEGNEIWNRTFGGPGYECGISTQRTKDRGYIITGRTHSYGSEEGDLWLIKTDHEGNEMWNRTFGGGGYDVGRSVQETGDGGYVVVGETTSYGSGSQDIWILKTDAAGNEQWNKTFGGAYYDACSSVLETKDGGYIIAGHTESFGYLPVAPGPTGRRPGNAWLIKTDSKGDKEWDMNFDGGGLDSVRETKDGGYVIAGYIHYITLDIQLIKLKEM